MTDSRLTEKAQQLLQRVEGHRGALEQILRRPQKLLFLLDMAPPWVSRRILSLASGLLDPHLLTKGMTVEEWGHSQVGLNLPNRWINRLGTGGRAESLTNILSMAQLCIRMFWEWQMGFEGEPIEISQLQWERLQNGAGGLKARYRVEPSCRDEWMFYLQRDGRVEIDAEVLILDHRDMIIGVVRGHIILKGPKYLP